MFYTKLGRTDMMVSRIGIGGASFGGVWIEKEVTAPEETLIYALNRGINYIDTAPWYGERKSEKIIGNIIKDIDRSNIYLATKVGRYKYSPIDKMFDFSYNKTIKSITKSMSLLNTNYLDLVQIHDPEFAPNAQVVINGALRALDDMRRHGHISYIGLTGYGFDRQKEILEGAKKVGIDIHTSLTYGRVTLHDRSGIDFMKEIADPDTAIGGGVATINASAMGMGLYTPQGPPEWFSKLCPEALKDYAKHLTSIAIEEDLDISRIALSYSCMNTQQLVTNTFYKDKEEEQYICPMTLISCMSPKIIDENIINSDLSTIDMHESEFMKYYLTEQYNWKGVEVNKYFTKLGKYMAEKYLHK